jgi:aspartate-semialdehyde dehydrogenase
MKKYNVALVGIGAVGNTMLEILNDKQFPVNNIKILATKRSAGKKINFNDQTITVEETKENSFSGVDIALFAGGAASKLFAREAVKEGAVVIDNSSAFRLEDDVPLVVPEVNPEDLKWHNGLIANPNCSTIQMVVALKPLHDNANIKKVIVSTYQAVSGAGQEAMDELVCQTKDFLDEKEYKIEAFDHQIAFNLIPHIDRFMDNDYTREEMKMVNETQKMFHNNDIKISATCVRVPVLRSHSEAITIETENEISPDNAKNIFKSAPGIIVVDNPKDKKYPMPFDCSNKDEVFVGRIRKDMVFERGLSFWVVADQLRKGAATNAVQIAEKLIEEKLI